MSLQFARIADVKVGDTLIADGGFACLPAGAEREVINVRGDLCIGCAHGWHTLDGQDSDGFYVGLRRKGDAPRSALVLAA